ITPCWGRSMSPLESSCTRASFRSDQKPSRSTTYRPLSYRTFLTTPAHQSTASPLPSVVRRSANLRACWYGTRPGFAANVACAVVHAPRPLKVASNPIGFGAASSSRRSCNSRPYGPTPSPHTVHTSGSSTVRSRPSHSGCTQPLPVTPGWPGAGGSSTAGPSLSSLSAKATRYHLLVLYPRVGGMPKNARPGVNVSASSTAPLTTSVCVSTGSPAWPYMLVVSTASVLSCASTSHSVGWPFVAVGSSQAGNSSPTPGFASFGSMPTPNASCARRDRAESPLFHGASPPSLKTGGEAYGLPTFTPL